MRLSIFADSRFTTDGRGNYYSSSNVRKALLYPIAERCEQVLMICRVTPGGLDGVPPEDLIHHPKIKFIEVSPFRGPVGALLARRSIRHQVQRGVDAADVCILRFGSSISCIAAPLVRRAGKPSIAHVVGEVGMEIRQNPKHIPIPGVRYLVAAWSESVNRAAFQSCDVLCGVTETIARRYAQPGRAVHQLLDSCLAAEHYTEPHPPRDGPPRAVFAGRLAEFKNVQSFLLATAAVKATGLDVHVTVAGDGNYRSALVALTRQLGLTDQVEFPGRIESRRKLWNLNRSADLAFLLSLSEGLPLGAIEPMSAGLPLIAANRDYMAPVVTDGVEGFLVDPQDVDAIADKLRQLILDPPRRFAMGRAAYERSRNFSADRQAQTLCKLAAELCARRGAPA